MSDRETIDVLAGEYVLGTLDVNERANVARRRRRDQALDAAIQAWERHLAPLDEATENVLPPADLLSRIEMRIIARRGAPAADIDDARTIASVARLEAALLRWRNAAVAGLALAAGLAFYLLAGHLMPKPPGGEYIAVLQPEGATLGFLVSADLDRGTVSVRLVDAPKQPDRSYALWLLHDRLPAPRSLGVIGRQPLEVLDARQDLTRALLSEATLAVTTVPETGQLADAPSGPYVYTSKLMQIRR